MTEKTTVGLVQAIRKAKTYDEVCDILEISPNSPEGYNVWLMWMAWKGGKV